MLEMIIGLMPWVGLIVMVSLYAKWQDAGIKFAQELLSYQSMYGKKIRWLRWMRYVLPVELFLNGLEMCGALSKFSLDTINDTTTIYIYFVLVEYVVRIFMVSYLYIGLCNLRKSIYLLLKYWFFVTAAIIIPEIIMCYMCIDINIAIEEIIRISAEALIIGIPHAVYIGKRKKLFKN